MYGWKIGTLKTGRRPEHANERNQANKSKCHDGVDTADGMRELLSPDTEEQRLVYCVCGGVVMVLGLRHQVDGDDLSLVSCW